MTDDFTAPSAVVTQEPQVPVDTDQATGSESAEVSATSTAPDQSAPASTEVKAEETKPEKPAGPTEEEIVAALDGFKAVLDKVSGFYLDPETNEADPSVGGKREVSTGAIDDDLKHEVQSAFAGLPKGSTKASARPRAKDEVDARLLDAMTNMDMPLARSLFTVQQECLVVRGATSEGAGLTVKVDPTTDFVNRVAGFSLAAYALVPGEDVEADWPSRVEALVGELVPQVSPYVTWLAADEATRGDEPETHDLVKTAVKISQGKGAGVRRPRKASGEGGSGTPRAAHTGVKRSIAKHIEEAFAGKAPGTWLSIADISKFESTEYGTDKPSQGALAARIYAPGGCTIDGIRPQENGDGKKGAVKV